MVLENASHLEPEAGVPAKKRSPLSMNVVAVPLSSPATHDTTASGAEEHPGYRRASTFQEPSPDPSQAGASTALDERNPSASQPAAVQRPPSPPEPSAGPSSKRATGNSLAAPAWTGRSPSPAPPAAPVVEGRSTNSFFSSPRLPSPLNEPSLGRPAAFPFAAVAHPGGIAAFAQEEEWLASAGGGVAAALRTPQQLFPDHPDEAYQAATSSAPFHLFPAPAPSSSSTSSATAFDSMW